MNRRLPRNWQQMEFLALWKALNDPRRHPTPQVVIEAIMLAVRERGVAALREPANLERLARCDRRARNEINRRITTMLEKGITRHDRAA
jgi:hypothetical protein